MTFDNIELHGARVKLRWLTHKDIDGIFKIFSNKEAMRYWNTPPMETLGEAELLIDEAQADYRSKIALRFGIENKETAALLGTCSLFNHIRSSRRAEIGYILNRDFWRQGYMNEALAILINYAFDVLDLNRLEADVDPRNYASAKTLLKLGFVKEGYLRERWIVNGEISDTELYGLLKKEWNRAGKM